GRRAGQALEALEGALPNLLAVFAREKARAAEIAARVVVALRDLVLFRDAVDLRSPLFAEARRAADAALNAELRVRTRVLEAGVILEIAQPEGAAQLLGDAIAIAGDAHLADAAADAQRSLGWALLAM